ncbi:MULTISPECIES: glucosyltransferase domain-containing protein [Francisella]|uniref:glucosyltransferase domain-containing protein n=1 Tax=Francisella TaxID=262 RepID=UPI0011B6ABA8|nr:MULTISPECIES: glucosyltransferase domain-containing protein [Francisella]
MRRLLADLKEVIIQNNLAIKITLLCSITAYAYFIASWTISIDTELATYGLGNSKYLYPLDVQFLRLGRPILSLIVSIIGTVPIPYFNSILALGFIFCSYIVWIAILNNISNNKLSTIIFGLFYLISPVYIFQLNFVNQSIEIGLGFLLSSLSVYFLAQLFQKENWLTNILLSSLMIYFALGIYQSFIVYYIEGMITVLILNSIKKNLTPKEVVGFFYYSIFVAIIALVLYFITTHISYFFVGKSNYLTNFYDGWHTTNLANQLSLLFRYILNTLDSSLTISYGLCYIILLALMFKLKKLDSFIVLIGIITPLLLPIVLISPMPLRILFTIPLSIAMLASVCFEIFRRKKLILIVAIIIALINFKQICLLTYSKNMAQAYNQRTLNSLYQNIYDKIGTKIYNTAIIFIASKHIDNSYFIKTTINQPFYLNSNLDLFSSIFPDSSWQESNLNHRVYYFLHWLNDYYKMPTEKQIDIAKKISINLPVYPQQGSIIKNDNSIIIKLSN